MVNINLKNSLIQALKAAEDLHYQNMIYRGILEMRGPRNWKADYERGIQDQELRQMHHVKQGFRKAFELIEQQDDPEQLIQALLRIVPTSKDMN